MSGKVKLVTPPMWDEGQGHRDKTQLSSNDIIGDNCGEDMATVPESEIIRLHGAGYSLLPLGGGADGKSPLTSFSGIDRLPVKRVLGPMHGKGVACYGVRLPGLAVIDCDDASADLVAEMEVRFGASPVHVQTPRGMHLYYRHDGGDLPNLRGDGLPVDIKRGPTSYVTGPKSARPDGGVYTPVKGVLGLADLPRISAAPRRKDAGASIPVGDRNRELSKAAISWVETVDDPDELFQNLVFQRDDRCEDAATVSNEELRKIADWAWSKRLEGKVYMGRDSEFRVHRGALDRLARYGNASDAIALLVTLQDHHGHIAGRTFPLDFAAMKSAGLTSLGRRRFNAAVASLLDARVLGVAKEYSAGHSPRTYRLLRCLPDLPNVQRLFPSKEAS